MNMKRYTSLLFIAFIVVFVVAAGNTYLAGYADRVEENKATKSLKVYTTLPVEQAALLAAEYEKTAKVKISFIPLATKDLLSELKNNAPADLVLADRETLQQAAAMGALAAYSSEQADLVVPELKDVQGFWVGVWYDPFVFCANKDYLRTAGRIPDTWSELAADKKARIGLTDFLAADASANLLFTLIAQYDEATAFAILRDLHPRVVQYAKYLSTPVRMAGMGEVDISIAVQSEAVRYINEGFPLSLIYPADGTACQLTGAGIVRTTADAATARGFLRWLLEDDAQLCLQQQNFFFVPANHETLAYKSFSGKNLVLFENYSDLTADQKHDVLDRWVKNIRLK